MKIQTHANTFITMAILFDKHCKKFVYSKNSISSKLYVKYTAPMLMTLWA